MNQNSILAVNSASFSRYFCKPCYDSYCFSGIPGFIAKLLGVAPISSCLPEDVLGGLPSNTKHVIVVFIDALGWNFIEERLERSSLLKEFLRNGVVSKLTSQFPSTTSAHVTTLATGLPVGEHGVYEWNIYDPTVQAIIRSLPFSLINDDARNTLIANGFTPKILIPGLTLSEHLVQAGISVNIFQDPSITASAYSKAAYNLADIFSYRRLKDGLISLVDTISSKDSKSYTLLYYDKIDSAAHQHGPQSKYVDETIDATFKILEEFLHQSLIGKIKDSYLLIVSDHGQVSIDPNTTIFLNKVVPQLEEWILKDKDEVPLVPAGSPRDFFLHLRKESVNDAYYLLNSALKGRGEIYYVDQLIEQGFFGDPNKTAALKSRVGDIVALPYQGESFWWAGLKRSILRDKGFHGGLTRPEVEIPFIVYPLGN